MSKARVLVLCTANSARSQMAEEERLRAFRLVRDQIRAFLREFALVDNWV